MGRAAVAGRPTLLAVAGAIALVLAPAVHADDSSTAYAQELPRPGSVRTAVRLSADTVGLGEPFTIGVVAVSSAPVRFPPLLGTVEGWEQLEVARVETGEAGERRAFYRLVAWETGRLRLPELALGLGPNASRTVEIDLPGPFVRSVLPADAADAEIELRGPRAPLGPGFPWWLLVALLALLALAAWLWWSRRQAAAEAAAAEASGATVDPAERARAALVALRARTEAGDLSAGEFYDRLEEILRAYLADTREWPATRPVRASRWLDRGAMRELHRHAVVSRFAGVDAPGGRLLADADLSLDWLSKDAA